MRSQISLVTQHVTLFNDSIANNIAYGALNGTPLEKIREVALKAHATDFVSEKAGGFDAMIGDNGISLSGGQRQRIAIARALLKEAPILILDEATSALDNESENAIQQHLDELMDDKTTIVIAHRLSTIENADTIVVMDLGRVVEQGTHAELLAKNGEYARLYRSKFSEEPPASTDDRAGI